MGSLWRPVLRQAIHSRRLVIWLDRRRLAGDPWYDRTAMISECAEGGDRWPPLLPSQFTERLDARAFTEGKDDKALVSRLYASAFREEMRRATRRHASLLVG